MILTVNIGNTHITAAAYAEGSLRFAGKLSATPATSDEYAIRLIHLLTLHHSDPQQIQGVILASVVPALTGRMMAALRMLTPVRIMTVGPGLKSGLKLRLDQPAQLGAELLCGVVAAMAEGRPPMAVIFSDTALSIMAVNAQKELVGGVILPGPQLSLTSLVQNTAPQVTFMSDLAVFDLPCVFDSLDDCRAKLDDPDFYQSVCDVYTQGGYHLLGMADQGFRIMSTNRAVYSLDDFKGQKIRTMENPYHLDFWQALGAKPTPMSFSEVYIGLQQHTIDAQENPYEVIVSNRLYEQQDYIVETNHLPHLISLIVNDQLFQSFSEEDQAILTQAAQTATQYAREQSDARISQRIDVIEESGTQIITLSQELRDEIRARCQGVYDAIEQAISPELYQGYTQ